MGKLFPEVPGTDRCLRPDAPDAAVRIFDSVRAGRVTPTKIIPPGHQTV